jgi:hypothetical protein
MKTIIFLFFWFLTTFAISRGDAIGIFLSTAGFLFLFTMAEELEEHNERY